MTVTIRFGKSERKSGIETQTGTKTNSYNAEIDWYEVSVGSYWALLELK